MDVDFRSEHRRRVLRRDAEQTILCLEGLSKKQRFLVHNWCNNVEASLRELNKNMTFSHYSEPYMDPDDLTRAKRRLRLELQQLVDGKARLTSTCAAGPAPACKYGNFACAKRRTRSTTCFTKMHRGAE